MTEQDILKLVVKAEVDRAIAGLQKYENKTDSVEKRTKRSAEEIRKQWNQVGNQLTKFVTLPIGIAGTAAVKFAMDAEQMAVSLRVMIGDAAKASKVFREWEQFAANTPFQFDDLSKAGKQLLALGSDTSEVTEELRRLGDISAGLSIPIAELADIYGRARVQQTLYTQDLKELAGRGIPIYKALADELGVAESQVNELASTGAIKFESLENAIKSITGEGGQFAGLMQELSQTTGGKLSTAIDNAKLSLRGLGEVALPVISDILDSATELFKGFSELDEGTKQTIVTLGLMAAAAGPIIKGITGVNAALTAIKTTNPWVFVAAGVFAGVAALVSIFGDAKDIAEQYDDALQDVNDRHQQALGILDDVNEGEALGYRTKKDLIDLYPNLSEMIKTYTGDLKGLSEAIDEQNRKEALQATSDFYTAALKTRFEKIKELQNALNTANQEIASPSFQFNALKDEILAFASASAEELDMLKGEVNDLYASLNKDVSGFGVTPVLVNDLTTNMKYWLGEFREVVNESSDGDAGDGGTVGNPVAGSLPKAPMSPDDLARELDIVNRKMNAGLLNQQGAIEESIRLYEQYAESHIEAGASLELSSSKALQEILFLNGELENLTGEQLALNQSRLDEKEKQEYQAWLERSSKRQSEIDARNDLEQQQQEELTALMGWVEQTRYEQAVADMDRALELADLLGEDRAAVYEYWDKEITRIAKEEADERKQQWWNDLSDVEQSALRSGGAIANNAAQSLISGQGAGFADIGIGSGASQLLAAALPGIGSIIGPLAGTLVDGLLGGIDDAISSEWTEEIAAQDAEIGKAIEALDASIRETENTIKEEKGLLEEIRDSNREHLEFVKGEAGVELEVLKDQWDRGLISTEEYQAKALGVKQRVADVQAQASEAEAAQQAKVDAAQAQQDLQEAKSRKLTELRTERAQYDERPNFLGIWLPEAYTNQAEHERIDARIASVQAAANLDQVWAAKDGASFVTKGPQLMLVGEAGPETVDVRPAPINQSLRSSSAPVININAPVYGVDHLQRIVEEAWHKKERQRR